MSYANNGYKGLSVTFGGGDRCGAAGVSRSTVVSLKCDADRSNIDGTIRFVGESPPCQFNFEMLIRDACPTCGADSFKASLGPCQTNGSQSVYYYRVPEAEGCYGGVPLPPSGWGPCNRCTPNMYDGVWSSCVEQQQQKLFVLSANFSSSTCVQTLDSFPRQEKRPCEVLEAKPGTNAFSLIVSIILVITIVVGIYMWWVSNKKRNLLKRIQELEASEMVAGGVTVPALVAPSSM